MSLTSFLELQEVKDRFKSEFKKPNMPILKKILVEPQTENYSLVGTAFDYLLRFYVKSLNPNAIDREWVAYNTLENLNDEQFCEDMDFDISDIKKAKKMIKSAEKKYTQFLVFKTVTDDLIISTLHLANLDTIFRCGYFSNEINYVNEKDIDDLRNLISIIDPCLFTSKNCCILNPTFGYASDLVGGADADLIIDNTLIDIKTTVRHSFTQNAFNQLIGYVILKNLGNLYINNPKSTDTLCYSDDRSTLAALNSNIERIGIYFSRFNHFYTMNIKDILPNGEFNWKFLMWFEKKAIAEFQSDWVIPYFTKSKEREFYRKKLSEESE